ncbi:MAG: hypothetical protein [Podoviridae sp. ctQNx1]|nr:MAG: hypothetical protein [Podoviridae sp. ctQNx1]UOF78130.1 hypothetical protein [Caudoviricetes sp.]
MSHATLQSLIKQMETHHSPSVRNVIAGLERLIAERDAYQFKYEKAIERIECLECQLANREKECPAYIEKLYEGKFVGDENVTD